ncbi:VRR-NUC domain-containing protein [Candidatus Pacearchaeota archaeon]|nr:VRR-NUC domain-containing protein [Candidatus Pacearchaeota archaeon]
MEIKILSDWEKKIITKFSKFIITFNDSLEFRDYIKKNNLKINLQGSNEWLSKKYSFEKYMYADFEGRDDKYIEKNYSYLRGLTLSVIYLKGDNDFKVFFPLDKFIKRLESEKKFLNIEKVFELISKAKNIFLYLNKEYMFYDEDVLEVETIEIKREYVDTRRVEPWEGKKIIVLGNDGEERTVEKEAIEYFKEKDFNAIRTKWFVKNYLHNFLEKKELRKLLKKEDLYKIREREGGIDYQFNQFSLTGFPDLFVWDNEGDYFFVEVKSKKDKLFLNQFEWIRWNMNIGKFKFKMMLVEEIK